MGQLLSSISGSETTSSKKTTPSYSSRQYSQYDYTQRKSESTFSTFQPSYDTEWSKRLRQAREREVERLREQEAERLRQARRAREQQEAERLRQARRAREQQEAERLRQARQAREQEAERLRQAREREAIKLFLAGKREKASQVTKNTTSLSNRSYNNVTSGTKNNAPYNIVASSGIKTTTVVIPKVTSETKASTSEENTTSLSKEDRDNIRRITEIVRNVLTRDKNYVVYGNWSCPHWPNSCNNEDEWQRKYSLESFRRYLKLDQKSKKDFFMNECKGCDKKSLVTSFFLYNQQPTYASKEPSVEIVCRLEWNNHYRVFADWKCKRPQHPQHEWKSSYTWISLRNYIENSPLKEGDYYVQKCYDCREECKVCKKKPKEERGCKKCDHDTVILKRSPLVQSTGGKPHKRWLCAKCKGGSICRTDNNYRVPRRRNIELFE